MDTSGFSSKQANLGRFFALLGVPTLARIGTPNRPRTRRYRMTSSGRLFTFANSQNRPIAARGDLADDAPVGSRVRYDSARHALQMAES